MNPVSTQKGWGNLIKPKTDFTIQNETNMFLFLFYRWVKNFDHFAQRNGINIALIIYTKTGIM